MKKIIFGFTMFIGFSTFQSAEARLTPPSESLNVSRMQGVRISTTDATNCFPAKLAGFVNELRTRFGSVNIVSGNRPPAENRRRGGARNSQHIGCKAVDFTVPGVPKKDVKQFLITNFLGRAGIGFYCNGRYHLDVGGVRQWGGCQPSSQEIIAATKNINSSSSSFQITNVNVAPVSSQPNSRSRHPRHHRHHTPHRNNGNNTTVTF